MAVGPIRSAERSALLAVFKRSEETYGGTDEHTQLTRRDMETNLGEIRAN